MLKVHFFLIVFLLRGFWTSFWKLLGMPPGISKTRFFFKTGTLGCFCFSKGTISQTWDFWKTKAAKSTSFENKKVPKYQFLKYQVAYQAVFKMMSKKKKKKNRKHEKMNFQN